MHLCSIIMNSRYILAKIYYNSESCNSFFQKSRLSKLSRFLINYEVCQYMEISSVNQTLHNKTDNNPEILRMNTRCTMKKYIKLIYSFNILYY